ncbi:MAG TPA: hypothetical protein VF648_05980 [Pyrinomonadaceae bacterium]
MKIKNLQVLTGKFLVLALFINSCLGFIAAPLNVAAQTKPIIITADQPNLWTLEQAHYLLAQMHRRNLDLKAKGLSALDPNDINGVRFDVLKQLFEIGATFDQAAGFNNNLLAKDKTFNSERRRELVSRRDALQEQSLDLSKEIARLNRALANAGSEPEKTGINAEITERTAVQAAVDKQIKLTDEELKTLNSASGDFKSVQPGGSFDATKFQNGMLDGAFKKATDDALKEFSSSPQLNAQIRLENYLQMQYEIISKQLTLLRDEVGPGERLVFLELPQSISASFDKADQKWAQSWWRIAGYTKNVITKTSATPAVTPTPKPDSNQRPITTSESLDAILKNKPYYLKTDEEWEEEKTNQVSAAEEGIQVTADFVDLDDNSNMLPKLKAKNIKIDDRRVRTVELIPRQSSINVNDIKLRNKAGVLNVVASFLFGFGAKLNLQRQREQFSQFVQQELYSSAFGKGSREFGWTFTPMPGTNRLMSGVRTTYAVVVVPREATAIVLETTGCYFPRSAHQPSDFNEAIDTKTNRWQNSDIQSRRCNAQKGFVVPIPGGGEQGSNDFYVSGLTYKPVKKNEQIVVSIYGNNFSAQTGILINGVPLKPALGLAQPFIVDDSLTRNDVDEELASETVQGRYERVDANQLIATFRIKDFEKIPVITIIAPGKAIDLNRLNNLRINQNRSASLDPAVIEWMFGERPPPPPAIRIEGVAVFRRNAGTLIALVSGAGFARTQSILINGDDTFSVNQQTPSLWRVEFPAPLHDKTIEVSLVVGDRTIKAEPVPNPAYVSRVDSRLTSNTPYLGITEVKFVSYEDDVLVVEITGYGFNKELVSSMGELAVTSPTKAFLKIVDPEPAVTLRLTDEKTKSFTETVITRAPPPAPASEKDN